MEFNLTQRQQNILLAIVLDYIATAEPVGSRTISKKYDLGLSPATIRNDMAELEDLGLLTQPHSSSGRIPSDLGYRNFVDYLMEKPTLSNSDKELMKNIRNNNTSSLEFMIDQSARVLSALSNTVALIQVPESNKEFIKHFQLLPINENTFVTIVVTNTGKVHNFIVKTDKTVNEGFFSNITGYLTEQLLGTPISNLQKKLNDIITGNQEYDNILRSIYNSIKNNLSYEKNKIYVSGTSNLLKEPEFNENQKAHSLMNFFEIGEKQNELSNVFLAIGSTLIDKSDPIVLIGKEIKISQLENCSLIIGSYNIGEDLSGSIGLLGPTRMQYGKSLATLEEMIKNLSNLLTNIYDVSNNFE
ncbi:MAG: heat-inducible transcription repressor HrcA [Candidatus Sericytochromatia bacterium]|nr:heat-inducible transcription repressor HrcA [Candidatus Sericytochromatia bacterium]